MSVRVNDRSEGDLDVIIKAKELCLHTYRLTHNEKVFPKRYRLSIVKKLQDDALEIVTSLVEANEMYPKPGSGDFDKTLETRLFMMKRAMALCRSLQTQITIAMELFDISAHKTEYWSGLARAVRNQTVGWYNSELKRHKP